MARTSRLVMKLSLVAEKGFGLDLGRQPFRLGDVVSVARGEAERQWIAKGVDDHVDFRGETAARAADGLVVTPFFRAPALCWCALTMVASIIAYSLSGSSAKVLKRLSQTPLAAQREKRLWMFFQSPKRSGKSRHGAPERNFQITVCPLGPIVVALRENLSRDEPQSPQQQLRFPPAVVGRAAMARRRA